MPASPLPKQSWKKRKFHSNWLVVVSQLYLIKRITDIVSSYKGASRLNRTEQRFRNSESASGDSPSEVDDVDDKRDNSHILNIVLGACGRELVKEEGVIRYSQNSKFQKTPESCEDAKREIEELESLPNEKRNEEGIQKRIRYLNWWIQGNCT